MAITPLFAIEAQNLLNDGKIQEAIDLCKEGLLAFPNYAAGEGVLARAYKMLGDESKAEQTLNSAITRNPFNKGLKSIKKQKLEIPDFKIEAPKPKTQDELEKEKRMMKDAPELDIDDEMKEFYGEPEETLNDDSNDSDDEILELDELLDGDEDEVIDEVNEDILSTDEESIEEIDNDILVEDNLDETEDEILELEDDDLTTIEDNQEEFLELEEDVTSSEIEDFDDSEAEVVELDVEDPDLIPGLRKLTIDNNISFSKEEFELIIESSMPNDGEVIELVEAKKKTKVELKDDVEDLAKSLDGAKIIPSEDSFPKPQIVEEDEIITPTIAEILVEQGAYNEAIDAFKSLKKLHPEREKEFKKRIKEIKKLN